MSNIITETGCYFDNHRGHYIVRDVVEFAVTHGFIIGPFEQYAVDMYDEHNHEDSYPQEALIELCQEATNWLNSGHGDCVTCAGMGRGPTLVRLPDHWLDKHGIPCCKTCTGTGRGDRIAGQNFPPRIIEGAAWDWNDGDFGLYMIEDLSD